MEKINNNILYEILIFVKNKYDYLTNNYIRIIDNKLYINKVNCELSSNLFTRWFIMYVKEDSLNIEIYSHRDFHIKTISLKTDITMDNILFLMDISK